MIDNNVLKSDKKILVDTIKQYINIIKLEYGDLVKIPDISDYENIVNITDTGTISLFVSNGKFYFPIEAYKVLDSFKNNPIYGTNKTHVTYNKETLLVNNNTFYTYIDHLILKGASSLDYFLEILLHETLHFCGSRGGSALMEGINEYLTRKLAFKYNLKTNGCGYPKEIKIIVELEKLFGEEILREIAFSNSTKELETILNGINKETTELFFALSKVMEEEFYNKYYKFKYPGLLGPINKAKKYDEINYENAHELIDSYKLLVEHNINNR